MSKIAKDTTATILDVFAGQTVAYETVCEQIDTAYAAARRRPGFRSYFNICTDLWAAGVTVQWSGPNYSGDQTYKFPAR